MKSDRCSYLVLGAGLAIIAASRLLVPGLAPQASLGALLVEQDHLTWRSPVEKAFRVLGIDEAQATFRIRNNGGTTVRILQVESSCGCAAPTVEPSVLPPGANGMVEVKAQPLQIGEREATVTLVTDSPLTPRVVLRLRIVGSRQAPFMAHAGSDLSFRIEGTNPLTLKINTVNIELMESPPMPPRLEDDLEVLEISSPTLVEERPYVAVGTVARKYEYDATVSGPLLEASHAGDVIVVDPWDESHVERLRVHVESVPDLTVNPSRLVFRIPRGQSGGERHARFFVRAREPGSELRIPPVGAEVPLTVQRLETGDPDQDRMALFSVGLEPGFASEGDFQIHVERSGTSDRATVHVAVRFEDSQ